MKHIIKTITGGGARIAVLLLFLILSAPTHALGLAQGYQTSDDGLKPGMVVQLSEDNGNSTEADSISVERATIEGSERVIGLAALAEDSFVLIGNGQQKVFVQTSGEASALVSDINGVVEKGDQLTLSPLKGVLMKASDNGIRFGTALEAFPDTYETYSIDGGSSGIDSTNVASININLDGRSFANQSDSAGGDSILSQIGRSVAGRDIGEIRVLIALIIFLIVLIAEGTIIYGAVSSAITAMGRNPLAGRAIKMELIRIVAIAIVVLLIGLASVYAILKV